MPRKLATEFSSPDALATHVASLMPWCDASEPDISSEHPATQHTARQRLNDIDPLHYGKTRNFLDGAVTKLSPYITHGMISLNEVRNAALKHCSEPAQIEKFLQELGWRDFWQRALEQHHEWAWEDVEPYKTGLPADAYSNDLPDDILNATTDCRCINQMITRLVKTGYLHNHLRMYLAAYIVHFRRVRWQAGAAWFLTHLVDGDIASNNLSWQWVASTFSGKPYIFNLENVAKYCSGQLDVSPEHNTPLDASYEALRKRLFPENDKAAS